MEQNTMKIRITLTLQEAQIVTQGLTAKVDKDMTDLMSGNEVDPKETATAYALRIRLDSTVAKVLALSE